MKNITIAIDEETAHWARVAAAKAGLSLSRYVGQLLAAERQRPDDNQAQLQILERILALGPLTPVAPSPSRETIYAERTNALLRRHKRLDLAD